MASIKILCGIFVFGILSFYSSCFIFSLGKPSVEAHVVGIGFGLCLSVLYSAIAVIINILKIFIRGVNNIKERISPIVIFGLIAVEVLGAIVLLTIDLLDMFETDPHQLKAVVACRASAVALIFSIFYNFGLILFSYWCAFRHDEAHVDFQHARYIEMAVHTICIVWVAYNMAVSYLSSDFVKEATTALTIPYTERF